MVVKKQLKAIRPLNNGTSPFEKITEQRGASVPFLYVFFSSVEKLGRRVW
jgi:hypothetical protein